MGRILVREVLGLAVSVLVLVIDEGRSNFLSPWSISSRFFSKKSSSIKEGTKHGFKWGWSTLCKSGRKVSLMFVMGVGLL